MSSGASVVHEGVPPSPVKANALKSKKRVTMKKPKKESRRVAHPPTATMVNTAIATLKERGGSSTQAIKKYVSSTYKIDGEKAGPLIRKYLKTAAEKGLLTRTKGKGASGSFKIHSNSPVKGAAASTAAKKPRAVIKLKKPKAPKKAKAAKPKRARKTPVKAKKSAKRPKSSNPKARKVVKKRVAKK